MNARRRTKAREGLPDNLYSEERSGGVYYRYRHPKTGEWHNWGYVQEKQAVDAANQLNSIFGDGRDLISSVMGTDEPIAKFVVRFRDEILPSRRLNGAPLSENTMKGYSQRLAVIEERLGFRGFADTTRKDISNFILSFPPRMGNVYRSTLIQVWRHAVAEGWADINLPEQTIPRDEEVKRTSLSLEGFHAVRENGAGWFRPAMDLALESLQGRHEVATMKWPKDGAIEMIRKKTKKYAQAHIRVHVWPELQAVIDACRDELLCPYIVHRRPTRPKAKADWPAWRNHHYQIDPVELTRAFQEARDKSGFYDHLSPDERPTFHEIRSLGGDLKRKAGWPEEAIQALYAHSDESMTRYYLGKHEHWVEVRAPENAG